MDELRFDRKVGVVTDAGGGPGKRGGNEFIDLDVALSAPPLVMENSYDERDVSLYALGVGAGANPLDPSELALVHERGPVFHVLPTYAVLPALNAVIEAIQRGNGPPGLPRGHARDPHVEGLGDAHRLRDLGARSRRSRDQERGDRAPSRDSATRKNRIVRE